MQGPPLRWGPKPCGLLSCRGLAPWRRPWDFLVTAASAVLERGVLCTWSFKPVETGPLGFSKSPAPGEGPTRGGAAESLLLLGWGRLSSVPQALAVLQQRRRVGLQLQVAHKGCPASKPSVSIKGFPPLSSRCHSLGCSWNCHFPVTSEWRVLRPPEGLPRVGSGSLRWLGLPVREPRSYFGAAVTLGPAPAGCRHSATPGAPL